jgi:hypothetical protein
MNPIGLLYGYATLRILSSDPPVADTERSPNTGVLRVTTRKDFLFGIFGLKAKVGQEKPQFHTHKLAVSQ